MFETTKGILSVGFQVAFGTVAMVVMCCLAIAACGAIQTGTEIFMGFIGR